MKTLVLVVLLASCLGFSASMPIDKNFKADPLLHIGNGDESSYDIMKEKRINFEADPLLQIDSKQGGASSYTERATTFSADELLHIGNEEESSYAR